MRKVCDDIEKVARGRTDRTWSGCPAGNARYEMSSRFLILQSALSVAFTEFNLLFSGLLFLVRYEMVLSTHCELSFAIAPGSIRLRKILLTYSLALD